MKKILILIIVIAFSAFAANASVVKGNEKTSSGAKMQLSGKVTDLQTGETLAGVLVAIEGSDLKTYTDLDGKFDFSNLTPGKYTIICSCISYNSSIVENMEINVPVKNALHIELQPSK